MSKESRETMRADELMIGDWYSWEAEGKKYYYQVTKETFSSPDYDIYNFQPIPLTPEIFEKNGFQYNNLPFVQGWEQFGLTLYSGGNGYRINCGTNVALVIDSVHELQHTLRLCGIKKTIEL